MVKVNKNRINVLNDTEPDIKSGEYVLYWVLMYRRTRYNHALQRAIEWANELEKPLLVFEPLQLKYEWASDRFQQFIIESMKDSYDAYSKSKAGYFPFVETAEGELNGLLESLASKASVVISDDYPAYFIPQMAAKGKGIITCKYEIVDSNGLMPIRSAEKEFVRAHDFRRNMHKNIAEHLEFPPEENPLTKLKTTFNEDLIKATLKKWEPTNFTDINIPELVSELPVDKSVKASNITGGYKAAKERMDNFLENSFNDYSERRSHPSEDVGSGLSPYFHFGNLSSYEVFKKIVEMEGWSKDKTNEKKVGNRREWWGMSENAEGFLDQLITWREVGFHTCVYKSNYAQYESLPEWALETLEEHSKDEREHIYSFEELENSKTHDEIWNAAQKQLKEEGIIQNYLRMLWGKKILEWTEHPKTALNYMIQLNNKYALDGRDPNSYSGIFWTLGRYDRAWGPERPIFGKIRYMTSDSTAKKFNLSGYLEKWS